jgi:hypothetical protein
MAHVRGSKKKAASQNKKSSTRASAPAQLLVPSPNSNLSVADVREEFSRITQRTPRNKRAQQAFIEGKLHILRTHPEFEPRNREALVAQFSSRLGKSLPKKIGGPVPGGVGYGVFYNPAFKTNFTTGTAICWDVICPNPPGGNVNTWLYLTATNRSSLGVEALVAYNGQNEPSFEVYDWARDPASRWRTNIPFGNLAGYFRTDSAHGHPYQALMLINLTVQSGDNYWDNQVLLWNEGANRWELIYQYGYTATLTQQTTGWVGSWAPIVETFQSPYSGTEPMGALGIQLISRGASQWGSWANLSATDSYIRTDNVGFQPIFLDPNYGFALHS